MVASSISPLIAQYRSELHGQLSDRRRVSDHLLDLRLAAGDEPEILAVVDRLLAELPGLTTVENRWWAEGLDAVEGAIGRLKTPSP